MSATPTWRRALPEPAPGKANVRIYAKSGFGEIGVVEEVIDIRDISLEHMKEIRNAARREVPSPGKRVVHVLKHGYSICGLVSGVPSRWPPGHFWVSYLEGLKSVTCATCIETSKTSSLTIERDIK